MAILNVSQIQQDFVRQAIYTNEIKRNWGGINPLKFLKNLGIWCTLTYEVPSLSFQTFFVWAFKIGLDS